MKKASAFQLAVSYVGVFLGAGFVSGQELWQFLPASVRGGFKRPPPVAEKGAQKLGRHLCLRKQGAAQMLSANPDLFAPRTEGELPVGQEKPVWTAPPLLCRRSFSSF